MRRSAPFLAALALLGACSREEEPVANKFERARAEIENKARAYEAQADNEVRAAEAQLQNEADLILGASERNAAGAADNGSAGNAVGR